MKPNFALSLSFEGIQLLHRAAGGWRTVGEVSVTSEDLAGELAVLRKTAVSLEPAGLRSKLIIPASQIKYLSIETPGLSRPARMKEAAKALENATPYEVEDLAFDISQDGPITHIAAVARETLEEAEAFAEEHRFHPVSFVAVPDDAPYLGEPFFGTTRAVESLLEPGEAVEPDGIAVVVIGAVDLSQAKTAAAEAAPAAPDTPPAAEEAAAPPPKASPAETPDAPEQTSEAPPPPPEPSAEATDKEPVSAAPREPAPADRVSAPTVPAPGIADPSASAAPDVEGPRKPTLSATRKVGGAEKPAGFTSRRSAPPAVGAAARTPARITPQPDSSSLTADPVVEADDEVAAPGRKIGFLSRRKPRRGAAAPVPAPAPPSPPAGSEEERMTVFGARSGDIGGKPRFLGLVMTVVLLVFLAGVAAWAAIFLDDGIAGLFGDDEPRTVASAPENQIDPEVIRLPSDAVEEPEEPVGTQVAALDPVLSAEDSAVLDALQDPRPEPVRPVFTEQEAAARYAVSGIWPIAPSSVPERPQIDLAPVFQISIDNPSAASDAIALPAARAFDTDVVLAAVPSPPPFGQTASVGPDGLIVPTESGVVAPGGYTLVAASPPLKPPLPPTRFAAQPEAAAEEPPSVLAAFRPVTRPEGLAESSERAQLGGVTRSELAVFRPALRPASVQERAAQTQEETRAAEAARLQAASAAAAAAPASAAASLGVQQLLTAPAAQAPQADLEDATRLATAQSLRPDTRPRNFARIIERAQRSAPAEETRVVAAARVAPRTVAPAIPSKASVAKAATVKNAINLRKVNLIGVYGQPSSRRALVRLSNGRYKKVRVGDRIDGGRVSAIGNSELRYTKGGRNVVLQMPKG